MVQDQQSYRRAANAAMFGLVVQAVLAAVMVLTASAGNSPALYAVAFHLLGGLPVWIVLLLLYHQHRLERAEALETEQLTRTDAGAGALFDEHADDLQIARRRLNNLYRWGLPLVSLLVAVYLLSLGGYLAYRQYALYRADAHQLLTDAFKGAVNPIGPMVVAAAVAFVAFIVARYEAGMTKVSDWQVLRGGASFLMGNFLTALLTAAGLLLLLFNSRGPLAALGLAVPALMVLLGAEVLLTFLLNAYRPRRPGEAPRPAFDSRVLGLLTTPKSMAKAFADAVNYQFGFEVSRSWFYQLLSQAVTPLAAFAIVVLVLVSSIVVVQPYEQAVVLRFGRIVSEGEPLGPGPHLKWPWPIETAEHYAVGRVHEISIGSSRGLKPGAAILWTKPHVEGGKEDYLITAATPISTAAQDGSDEAQAALHAPGMSLIGLQVVLQYRISNLMDYVKVINDPELMLTRIAESRLNQYLVTQDIDTLIGQGRIGAGDALRKVVQQDADAQKLGLEVVFTGFAGVHPPSDKEVADAFHNQIGALQDQQRMIEEGQREAIETLALVAGSRDQALAITAAIHELEAAQRRLATIKANPSSKPAEVEALQREVSHKEAGMEDLLTRASGRAAEKIYEARAYRWDRAISERARAQGFQAELVAFRLSPEIYRVHRYLEVLADGLATPRKYVVAGTQVQTPIFRLDLTDSQSAIESIMKNK